MKYFEMQPTYENVLNTFEEDALNRNIDVLHFAELINSMDTSCSIALDARWGAGKTFFVKQVKMVFDAFNDHIDVARPEDKDRIRKAWERIRVRNKPELQPHVSVYYDAWVNDNDEDPVADKDRPYTIDVYDNAVDFLDKYKNPCCVADSLVFSFYLITRSKWG